MPAKISVVQAHEPALYSQTGVSPVLRIGKNGMLPERIVLAGVARDRDADRQLEIMGDTEQCT
jgi:hypothetical protein